MSNIVTPIANAIAEGFKLLRSRMENSAFRKAEACIEAGEKYIQVNEGSGEFIFLSTEKKASYLRHYRKRFFHYN